MITTLHGFSNSPVFSALWIRERLDQLALSRIDLVVAVAKVMLNFPAVRRLDARRLRVIANGIPDKLTRRADLTVSGVPALPEDLTHQVSALPTLVAIGRLSPEKGFDLLLEAFARIRAPLKQDWRLVIVGDGPERAALMRRATSLGLHETVRLVGYLEGADRLLDYAAGFVMSSRTEGMPLALLEALQYNVPILATAVGAIPEMLPATRGRLVPSGDLDALVRGLEQLIESYPSSPRALDTQSGSARMAREYLDAYRSVV